jgi:hypothetical protein
VNAELKYIWEKVVVFKFEVSRLSRNFSGGIKRYHKVLSKGNQYYGRSYFFFSNGSTAPWGPRPPHFSRLHDHTLFRHTTFGRTSLDEGPARRRDLYLTTHNTHKRQTSMHPVGFFFLPVRGFSPLIHFCTV